MISISCNRNDNTGSKKPEGQVVLADDTRIIPEDSPLFKKVHLQVILPVNYHLHYSTTGTVQIMTGSLAELSTPFEGRVTKSFVRLGQKILTGSPVFEIYSPAYFETVKSFVQAKQENLLAETNYHRQKELFENGVGSKKEFEEAGAAQQIASRQYETAEASLLIFNVKPDEISLGKPLIVRSPIAGEIVKNQITVGQYLKSDAEPQAVVANLSKIWVVALVTEKNIRMINSNDSVHIITDGEPIQPINGIVTYIGSILDEQTRSFEVYVECKNDDKSLKPGMFANVAFTRQIQDAIIIPATAVLQEEDHTYVFVQTEKNKFIKRRVSVTTGNNQELIVNSGLKASETIVAEGAVYLR
jgi:cobalt-zinc-cadmium efflux system membrane fusion protein